MEALKSIADFQNFYDKRHKHGKAARNSMLYNMARSEFHE